MAQKVEVHLEDDLDGGPAEDTITFNLDGKDYEIDLPITNAEKLREALRPYAVASRKTARSSGARVTRSRASGGDPDTARIRVWANQPYTVRTTVPARTGANERHSLSGH